MRACVGVPAVAVLAPSWGDGFLVGGWGGHTARTRALDAAGNRGFVELAVTCARPSGRTSPVRAT